MAKIYRGTNGNLQFLARRLRAGELVAVPSETVYGLAADALNARACRKIFSAKARPANDPLIVHVESIAQAASVAELNAPARRLMRRFWPGPLTLVLPKKAVVPDVVTSGQASVAVRMPAHPLFLRLIGLSGTPLAAPSANPFGYVSPTTAQHVQDGLGRRIKFILDGGACEVGVESTIVDLRDPRRPRVLRPGKITAEALTRVLGVKVKVGARSTPKAAQPSALGTFVAPGMMTQHYSPLTPVVAHRRISARQALGGGDSRQDAWVFLQRPITAGKAAGNIFGWAEEVEGKGVSGAAGPGGPGSSFGSTERPLTAGKNATNIFGWAEEVEGKEVSGVVRRGAPGSASDSKERPMIAGKPAANISGWAEEGDGGEGGGGAIRGAGAAGRSSPGAGAQRRRGTNYPSTIFGPSTDVRGRLSRDHGPPPKATLELVAHNLFALLRTLDGQGWKQIHVELAPRGGLGDAINDRLRRAAAKRNLG